MSLLPAGADVRLVAVLGRRFYLGRCAAYQPSRFGVIHGSALGAELAALPEGDATRRARLLRLLGREAEAKAALAPVLRRRDAPAAAHAYHWESGDGGAAALERAVALEPAHGPWRLWRALALLSRAKSREALEEAQRAAALMPGHPLPHLASGLAWRALGRHGRVAACLDRALALEPDVEWSRRLRALARFETGDRDGCLEDCVEALRLDEGVGTLRIPLGVHHGRGSPQAHLAAATRRIEREPRAYWAYVYRAECRRMPELNDNTGALADLRKAVALAPACAWAWAYLARGLTSTGDHAGARAALARAVSLDPACAWIRAWQGEQLRRGGDAAGAAKALDRALALDAGYELAYAWRGAARRALGRPGPALADLDVALRLQPTTDAWCRHERMSALRALGRPREALDDLDAAWRRNPKFVWEPDPALSRAALAQLESVLREAPRHASALAWQGEVLMRRGDLKGALSRLNRAVKADPRAFDARLLRGQALGASGRWKAALADFAAAARLDPRSPFARAWRGRALMKRGDLPAALADLRSALRRERNSAWIWAWKGEAEFRLGRDRSAVADLTRALELHARYADAYRWRGAARARLGDARGGEADLAEALRLAC